MKSAFEKLTEEVRDRFFDWIADRSRRARRSWPPDAAPTRRGATVEGQTGPGREDGPGEGRAHDLAVAALHRPGQERARSPSSRTRPASTSSTSRRSTTTTEFFGKIRPLLAAGRVAAGADLITVSDWLARAMYDLGYLQKLDYCAAAERQEAT